MMAATDVCHISPRKGVVPRQVADLPWWTWEAAMNAGSQITKGPVLTGAACGRLLAWPAHGRSGLVCWVFGLGRNRTLLVSLVLGLAVPSDDAGAAPTERSPAGPDPQVVEHRIETHLMERHVLRHEVPAVLEVVIGNAGGEGDVLVRAEQRDKRWETRVHLRPGEKRKVRVQLSGAVSGLVDWSVLAERPPPPLPVAVQRHGGGFWLRLVGWMLFGGIVAFAISVLRELVLRKRRRPTPSRESLTRSAPGVGGDPVCSICGASLRAGEVAAGLCALCHGKALG
jgi:hypothetical protein